MSKRKSSSTYSVDALDYGSSVAKQTVIESQHLHEIPTVTALPLDTSDSAPVDFRIDRTDHFIDLNETYLHLKMQVLMADGKPLPENENVTLSNNIGYSMWSSVEVYINGNRITAENQFYQWMSYVHFLTKTPSSYRDSAMITSHWINDTAGQMDTNDITLVDQPLNEGAEERAKKIAKSGTLELYSRIFLDFVNLPQLIPSNTEVLIRFIPANTALSLMYGSGKNYRLSIQSAKLYVGKAKLTKLALTHYNRLLAKTGMSFNTRKYIVRTKLMQKGEQNVDWVPFPSVRNPRRVYIWQIDQKAYNGDPTKNIFNFTFIEMSRFQIYCNDISYPANVSWSMRSYDPSRIYLNTMRAINNPEAWNVTLNDYTKGYFIAVLDITKDQSATANYDSTLPLASIRVVIDYQACLTNGIALFCMCEYDDQLLLDSNRVPKWQS